MKYLPLLLLLAAPLSHAGDLELSLGVGLSNSNVTSATWAKPGCCYTIDFQDTKPNQNGSFGIFGGKLSQGIFFVGPTYSYAFGPLSVGTAVGVDRDHGAYKWGATPVIEYQFGRFSIDLAYLESAVKVSNGLILAGGIHF
jgi:hypothetical protein